jgi:iron complex outermembrane receptor protein
MDMESYGNYTDHNLRSAEARPQASVKLDSVNLRFLGGVDLYFAKLFADSFLQKNHSEKANAYNIGELTVGPYSTARFSPLPMLSLSGGVRFDLALIDAQKREAGIDNNKSYSALVYEAGIVSNPLESLKLYAKYSSLFRYPFIDELAQVSGFSDKFNTDLKPEKGFNAEAGAAFHFGKIFDLSVNFFFMQIEDEIGVAFPDAANPFDATNVNLNRTRRLGANAGLDITPKDFLLLSASYSFVNASFMNGENEGKNIPLVPSHKIFGQLTVNLPFGLNFGPDISFISASYHGEDYANEGETLEPVFLLGARARYTLKKESGELAIQISAKNLLNKSYASYGIYSWGSYYLYPADGRSVNFMLQYRF